MRWDLAAALILGLVVGYVLAVALTRPQIVATPMSDATPTDEHAPATGSIIATNVAAPLRTAPIAAPSLHLVNDNVDSLATA